MALNSLLPFRAGGLVERGGGDPFLSIQREMNRLFDDVFRGAVGLPATQGGGTILAPQMDVSETDGEIRVRVELPGVSQQDVDVTLDDDVLTIRGEKKLERKEKENFHFVERSFGTFQRSLRLPYPIEPEQVQARFESGVLSVTLPKTAQQDRSRRIQVQTDGGGGGGDQGGTRAATQAPQQQAGAPETEAPGVP